MNQCSIMKKCAFISHFQIATIFFSIIGWVLCIVAVGFVKWRVWRVDNSPDVSSGIVWIGIWDVCFTLKSFARGNMHCQKLDIWNHFVPTEISVSQDLLGLATVLEALAVVFIIFAWWSDYRRELSIIWNLYSIMSNSPINFPSSYFVPSPNSQHIGTGVPVGFVSGLSLSAAVLLRRSPHSL
uniref:Claudin 34 n=1 Tax=Crocodylus porosus TaxID=8502 RepID=A0A7M4EGB2_CROPO